MGIQGQRKITGPHGKSKLIHIGMDEIFREDRGYFRAGEAQTGAVLRGNINRNREDFGGADHFGGCGYTVLISG